VENIADEHRKSQPNKTVWNLYSGSGEDFVKAMA
jgi:hypothetical protein